MAYLDQLENRNSTLKALPVNYLLNKVALMPKTEDVENKYQDWVIQYEKISSEDANEIKEGLNKVETLIYGKKYQKAQELLKSLEIKVSQHEQDYEQLLSELTLATQVDVKNREEITNQKELFRNYRKMFQANFDNYHPYNQAIEKNFKSIQDSFTNIDVLLNQSQVDKARSKAASLEGELLKMKDVLNNLPAILDDLTKDLPVKYQEVEDRYQEVMKKKYNLDSLNVVPRLKDINNQIIKVLSNNNDIFLKDLQDTSHFAHQELDDLMDEINEEVRANEELDKVVTDINEESLLADKRCKLANSEFDEVKDSYILFDNEKTNLEMQTKLLSQFMAEKNEIIAAKMANNFTASVLEKKARNLLPKFKTLIIAFDAYLVRLDNLRTDEKRLYDEYYNMLYLIKDCESRLNSVDLPLLSHSYYDTINESKSKLDEILDLLQSKPLNIDLINYKVADACEIVYKLYDNSKNLLKTAQMAENTIIFGNRFRSQKPEINSMLSRAEIFFNNGEYTKSLSTAIEAIETIYPSIRSELLKYKTNQLAKSPIIE